MITVVEQDSNFRDVDWLGTEVVNVLGEHRNETFIIRDVSRCAVCEEWEPQRIDRQMTLDAIGRFVEAKALGVNAGITGILHRLRVDDNQPSPLPFF